MLLLVGKTVSCRRNPSGGARAGDVILIFGATWVRRSMRYGLLKIPRNRHASGQERCIQATGVCGMRLRH